MSRKFAALAILSIAACGAAAIVRAQNTAQPRQSLADKLSTIRDNIVGADDETDGRQPQQQSQQPASEENPQPTRMRDWSAGRKGMPTRRSPKKSDDAAQEQTNQSSQAPVAHINTPRTSPKSPTANRTTTPRANNQATHSKPAPSANGEQPAARTAQANASGSVLNKSQAPAHAPASVVAKKTPAVEAPAIDSTTIDSTAIDATSAPGQTADSPLKKRLEALRGDHFDGSNVAAAPAAEAAMDPSSEPVADNTAVASPAKSAASGSAAPRTAEHARPVSPWAARNGAAANIASANTGAKPHGKSIVKSGNETEQPAAEAKMDATAKDAATETADSGTEGAAIAAARRYGADNPDDKPIARVAKRENPKSVAAPAAPIANHSAVLVVRTIGPKKVTVGKPATYELVLENSGDAAANEVVVSVKLPSWAEVESAQASSGATRLPEAGASDGLQWRVARLEASSKQTLAVAIVPRKSTPFQLAVQWTFVPEATETVVEVQEPKLQIAVAGPSEISFGTTETYRITVSNPGTGEAENVTVLTSSSSQSADGLDKLVVGSLEAGGSKTLELKVTAMQSGTLLVRASATADGDLTAETSEKVLVRRAALAIAASGPETKYAGTAAVYNVKISNPGNAAAEGLRVEANLPLGAKFEKCSAGGSKSADGTKIEWSFSSLPAGGEQTVEVTCQLQTAGVNRMQFAAAASGQLADTAEVQTKVEALADLKLEVADPPGPIAVGEEVVYEVHIRNRGTKTAHHVGVVAFFSDGIEPTAATGGDHTIETGQVTFAPIEALDAGQEVVCKITARANKAGSHIFRTELACDDPETRLVAEETTRFYGEAVSGSGKGSAKAGAAKPAAKAAAPKKADAASAPAAKAATQQRNYAEPQPMDSSANAGGEVGAEPQPIEASEGADEIPPAK